jgi:hypothetical protein
LTDQETGNAPEPPAAQPQPNWFIRSGQNIERYFHDRAATRRIESPQDRASRRTANATVAVAFLTVAAVVVGGLQYLIFKGQLKVMADQLQEMKGTGKQTDDLISENRRLVEAAQGQLQTLRGQLDQFRESGRQTDILIETNKKLAESALKSADAARQSADSTIALERPTFFVLVKVDGSVPKEGPFDTIKTPTLHYTITNLGRVPGILRTAYIRCYLQREKFPDRPVVDTSQMHPAQNAIAAGMTGTEYPPCEFEQPFSKQDWLDMAAGRAVAVYTAILIYEGSLDYTYVDTVSYRVDLFGGGGIYPLGLQNYTNEQASPGRVSKGSDLNIPNVIWKPDASMPK